MSLVRRKNRGQGPRFNKQQRTSTTGAGFDEKKSDIAHWKQGKLLGVVLKIDVDETNSNDPATTARAVRKRMEAVTCKLNMLEKPLHNESEKPYTLR